MQEQSVCEFHSRIPGRRFDTAPPRKPFSYENLECEDAGIGERVQPDAVAVWTLGAVFSCAFFWGAYVGLKALLHFLAGVL